MGSMINLSVGKFEIDWGKNSFFADHSQIFQKSDLVKVPYYYVDEENPHNEDSEEYNLITEYKEGMSKPLHEVIERIELLGYTYNYALSEFQFLIEEAGVDIAKFSFEHLEMALNNLDVNNINPDYGDGSSFGKFFRNYIFEKIGLEKFVEDPQYVQFYAGDAMENLSAYSILHLISRNPSSRNMMVSWHFADVVENGWVTRETIIADLYTRNKFLIVTEGSSDANIIRHALQLLKPHVSDFFTFIDMKEGYPFSGTGSLINFTKGLISIAVQNNIVILYDNDAEGVASYNKTRLLNLPSNMSVLKLPDLLVFEEFKTIGPTGEHLANINGSAAAIECYLDIENNGSVRWTAYNKDLSRYQGELIEKRNTMTKFLNLRFKDPKYDYSKIEVVINQIITECIKIRSGQRNVANKLFE